MVQDIVLYMTENKTKYSSHDELLKEMKNSIEGILFFEERYPMLYAMVTKEEGFEYSSLEYFLGMRDKIINNKLSSEQASKVGRENGTLTVYNTKENELEVTRGCFKGSVDEFLKASEEKHDDQTHQEYRLLIEVAHSRITRARKDAK